jgi:hypothetical protein
MFANKIIDSVVFTRKNQIVKLEKFDEPPVLADLNPATLYDKPYDLFIVQFTDGSSFGYNPSRRKRKLKEVVSF